MAKNNCLEGKDVMTVKGKTYLTPLGASLKHKVHPQTVYYWVREGKVEILDLAQLCEGTPFRPEHFKSQSYIEEESFISQMKESQG
jgi:hypothetical protein